MLCFLTTTSYCCLMPLQLPVRHHSSFQDIAMHRNTSSQSSPTNLLYHTHHKSYHPQTCLHYARYSYSCRVLISIPVHLLLANDAEKYPATMLHHARGWACHLP